MFWDYQFAGLNGRNMIWFSIFAGLPAFFILRRAWKEGDLDPVIWKWFVRFIWLGSIAFFQVLELERYVEGLTYRPFFGLYATAPLYPQISN